MNSKTKATIRWVLFWTVLIAGLLVTLKLTTSFAQADIRDVVWSNSCSDPAVVEQTDLGSEVLVECVQYLTPIVTNTPIPPVAGTFVVDHTNLDLFDQIPLEFIEQARSIQMVFADRSVGSNISDGLTCLSYPDVASAPNHCKRPDVVTAEFTPSIEYDRSLWDFAVAEVHGDFYNLNLNSYYVVGYMPNYLEFNFTTSAQVLQQQATLFNYYQTLPQDVIYYTSSLARTIGTEQSMLYNAAARNYISDNGGVLVDIADIESHRPDGSECLLDGTIYPIICETYTTELEGGHLGSVSTGKIRIAKAIWIAMAYEAGWRPGGTMPPTASPVVPTATIVPPTSTATLEPPTATPVPSTATPVPPQAGEPYPEAPLCTNHSDTEFHTLWNSTLGCHYDHAHGDNPHVVDSIFGTDYYGWAGGEISYPWQTFGAMGTENDYKHAGYYWLVRTPEEIGTCESQFGDGCVMAFRAISHMFMNDHGAKTRYHSFFLEALVCDVANPEDCGIMRTGGWHDTGTLMVDSQPYDGYIVTKEEVMTRSPQPQKLHYYNTGAPTTSTWYPVSAWSRVSAEVADSWGAVMPPATEEFFCYGVPGCVDNNSNIQPHVIAVQVGNQQYDSAGVSRKTPEILDPEADGYVDFAGFSDRYGRILVDGNGDPIQNCEIGLDCVPLVFEHINASLQYQFRGDQLVNDGFRDYDIYFNGVSSDWIKYLLGH